MSTNYYAYKRIPLGLRRQEIAAAINATDERMRLIDIIEQEDNPKLIEEEIEEYIEHLSKIQETLCQKPVHLGHTADGWQFLWQVYPDENGDYLYYEPNLESIKAFLYDTENWIILDEYSTVYTPDEFFKTIGPTLYKKKGLYDSKSFYEEYPSSRSHLFDDREHTSQDGLRYTTDDFS